MLDALVQIWLRTKSIVGVGAEHFCACGHREAKASGQSRVRLATYFGPLAEINSGPSAEAYWTEFGVGEGMRGTDHQQRL